MRRTESATLPVAIANGNGDGDNHKDAACDTDEIVLGAEHLSAAVRLPDGSTLHTVNDVSLQLHAGQSYAIVGKSGSGKTSLISLLGLLNARYQGTLTLEGRDMAAVGDRQRARLRAARIGFVFQNYSLIRQLNVWENVALPLHYASAGANARTARQRRRRALDCLDQVGLKARAKAKPHMLSGGEQQRVAIARALAGEPKLIICDEPTGALDKATGESVMALLMALVATNGCTLVLVTHDPDLAALCQHRYHMEQGALTPC